MLTIVAMPSMFQSAPLTEVRGDMLWASGFLNDANVSIRSPHRSEGRFDDAPGSLPQLDVSIRSPHRSEGRCA